MAVTSSMIALAIAGGGTAFSAINQIRAGRAQDRAAQAMGQAEERAGLAGQRVSESQAQLAEYNAAVAEVQARDAIVRGEEEANLFRSRTRLLIGEQVAGYAAGNIDVGYGSAIDVQADAAFLGELDALTARTNASREAWGFRVEATDLRQRAAIAREEGRYAAESGALARQSRAEEGRAARSAARWNAAGTILQGGSSLLMSRYGFGRR
jgi:hypothetical protein